MLSSDYRQDDAGGTAIMPLIPDNFAYVIPVEDELLHTADAPFCLDQRCPCHEDDEAIAAVYQALQDGLLTPDEATDLVLGRLL